MYRPLETHSRYVGLALAAVSGTLLAFSFPHFGHPILAWVSLVPLLMAVTRSQSVLAAFWLGLTMGVTHFALTVYWIPQVMTEYGGLSDVTAWLVHFLLVAYLALFPALFAVGIGFALRRFGVVGLYAAPAIWVTTELGRIHLFTGFPWELLGYSQTPVLAVAQLASVVGVLGLSALVVLVNVTIVFAPLVTVSRRWRAVGFTTAIIGGTVIFGAWRLHSGSLLEHGTPLRVAAVQGNIAQHDKWNPTSSDRILSTYIDLTREAVTEGASLVVWPEAATPFAFQSDSVGTSSILNLARDTGAHLLFGTTEITRDGGQNYYNAAVMVDDTGGTVGTYRKHHLVPFGEYVPLRRLLFFASPLVETVGNFSEGPGPRVLMMDEHPVSAAICYEIIYPELVRGFVTRGSQLLTTVTNDAWYGRSAAPYQHFQQARMRAIEQGRFLVRAANTGISGVVDPYGRVVASTPLFERRILTADVRLLEKRTFYSLTGDMFGYGCVVIAVFVLGISLRRLGEVSLA